ncbi:phosphorylase family protein [Halomarina oriensis]|uniref:Phosphorylase n=1 Tax=Halomarina oriensis TaxID=671145 RepID=A0A6B0GGJ2_9EURY|nr:phosphorylase [Halomarina oriensis]MWG33650.1 phosphorylase [Halomarina oriensis]
MTPHTLRVVVLPAIGLELRPWLGGLSFTEELTLPGLHEPLRVTDDGVGVVPTGIGKADAATTLTALFASPRVDCSEATFLTAGIAGGPPETGPFGSVCVGDCVVDWDRKHRVTDDEDRPIDLLYWRERDYVYDLDSALADLAVDVAERVDLRTAGERVPQATRGTVLSGGEFWHGESLARQAEWLVDAYGAPPYRVTEMEAAGMVVTLDRFDALDRYVVVRGVANYDRPPADRSAHENLDFETGEHANEVAAENAYRVGRALVERVQERRTAGSGRS